VITEYIAGHQSEFWLLLGFAFLVIEVITGFTTGVFLFAGLGALTSGALMGFGVLPETWIAGLACTGISCGIITVILWKPLKKLQGNQPVSKDNSSDLIGYEFNIDSEISRSQPGNTSYSGIHWKVEIDHESDVVSIAAGQRVTVTSVEVGLFKVKPLG
jgi:membrane protein implicated in regulation of membrane protease activity